MSENKRMTIQWNRRSLFEQSRNKCAICGSASLLESAAITRLYAGGSNTPDNFIILCIVCHRWVDTINVSPQTLSDVKKDWVDNTILGGDRIIQWIRVN